MALDRRSTVIDSAGRRSHFGWTVLRLSLAVLIAIHGWARFLAGAVVPFGDQLQAWGFPLGLGIAAAITVFEIVGTVVLAFGRLVPALTFCYALIYAAGIFLVHAPAGWFVVGLGRNGAEYSVLLIICLLCVGLQHLRRSPHTEADAKEQHEASRRAGQ